VITDVVFAYSTAQNAFCCLMGAILNILCPRERRVFQSKLGVSSSNQCNLHHSPHTGHLEKKIKKGYNLFRTRCTSNNPDLHSLCSVWNCERWLILEIYYLGGSVRKYAFSCRTSNICLQTQKQNFSHKAQTVAGWSLVLHETEWHHREIKGLSKIKVTKFSHLCRRIFGEFVGSLMLLYANNKSKHIYWDPSFCLIITVVDQWKNYLRKLRLENKSVKIVCLCFKKLLLIHR